MTTLRSNSRENRRPRIDRIGDVGDLELVETQRPGLVGKIVSDKVDRVGVRDVAAFQLAADLVEALVNIEHEFMEMDPALAPDRTGREEQVHQQRLAAPDIAPDVDALEFRRSLVAVAEQPAKRRRLAGQPLRRKPVVQSRQLFDDRILRAIPLDFAGGDKRGIARGCGLDHVHRGMGMREARYRGECAPATDFSSNAGKCGPIRLQN